MTLDVGRQRRRQSARPVCSVIGLRRSIWTGRDCSEADVDSSASGPSLLIPSRRVVALCVSADARQRLAGRSLRPPHHERYGVLN